MVDRNILILEKELSMEKASEQVENQKTFEFIITEQGKYEEIGSVIDLLKVITDLQIKNARYANPLTLLPGNVPTNKYLDLQLASGLPFVVCYIGLDNFKPYNDCYGSEKGDQIITGLADILRDIATKRCDFIGHIGDDFIVVFTANDWQLQCEQILKRFSEWVRHRYLPEDQCMGGISAKDRNGQKQFYPLLSLSIGCVCLPSDRCHRYHDIAVLATEAKSMAKKQRNNSLFIYKHTSTEITDPPAGANSKDQQPLAFYSKNVTSLTNLYRFLICSS